MEQETFNVLIVLIPVITLGVGLLTWCLNERSKRVYEEYKRREERYSKLIISLKGFYVSLSDKELEKKLKTEFLVQVRLCWMYCPDEVIHKANSFLFMVEADIGRKYTDKERDKAVGELILAIRKDLISRKPLKKTKLRPEDFKHFRAM